jgi:hypothetical protein
LSAPKTCGRRGRRRTGANRFKTKIKGKEAKVKKSDFAKKRKEFAGKSIEELIKLLSSSKLQTRFFAEMCLRDATDT